MTGCMGAAVGSTKDLGLIRYMIYKMVGKAAPYDDQLPCWLGRMIYVSLLGKHTANNLDYNIYIYTIMMTSHCTERR